MPDGNIVSVPLARQLARDGDAVLTTFGRGERGARGTCPRGRAVSRNDFPATPTTFDCAERGPAVKELFGDFSKRPARCKRSLVLVMFIMAALAALTMLRPVRGIARAACGVEFTLYSSVVTDNPAIDCDTAETKAVNKAKLNIMNQLAVYVCPAECPTPQATGPIAITCVDCTQVTMPYGIRWDGAADAEGTYKCT